MPFIWYYSVNFDFRMRNWCFCNLSIALCLILIREAVMVFVSRRMSSKKLYLKLSLLGKEIILAQPVKEFGPTSIDNHISTIQCHSLACPKLPEIDLFLVGVCLKLLLTRVFSVFGSNSY